MTGNPRNPRLSLFPLTAEVNGKDHLVIGGGGDARRGAEMGIAASAGFPMDRVYFHGNNKSAEELGLALGWGVGRIVVDNPHELKMLREIAGRKGADILLRL